MELKKNPNADLNKRSTIYMQIGLIAVLLLSWGTIESKSYKKVVKIGTLETVDILDGDWAENVKVEQPKVEQPKPKVVMQEIKEVEDEAKVEETIVKTTDVEEDEVIPDIADIEVADIEEDPETIIFRLIEDAPIFPGCEGVAKSKRKACFTTMIHKHIKKNFQYPETAQEMGIQGRVYCSFLIDEHGKVTNMYFRGPDKNLEKEASRIMHKLPNMKPGKQRGEPVRVPFSIPITFKLAD